jgi:hypothetical protein
MRLGLTLGAAALLAFAAPAAAQMAGTPGADVLVGLAGDDRLRGGGGDDVLRGGPGNDDLSGGPGTDAATFADSPVGVTVTIDDLADDGPPGAHDNVQIDVEDVYGSEFADRLVGSAAANTLDGAGGNDHLTGAGGRDGLFGGTGDDRVFARDGIADFIDCGEGFDTAVVDERDRVGGCEAIDRRPAVPRVEFAVANAWSWSAAYTVLLQLQVRDLAPAGTAITLRCTGPGCPRELRRPVVARNLRKPLADARLRPGAVVEIAGARAGHIGRVVRYRVRSGTLPSRTVRCSRPGSRVLGACPTSG